MPLAPNRFKLTPRDIRRAVKGGLVALEQFEEEINRLNVFPVPDGDTGTNLMLTLKAAVEETDRTEEESVAALAKAVSHGSLMGARGNSGVILSQIIKGICDILVKRQDFTPQVLAEALRNAKKISFAAVRKPVQGTMLTLISDVAGAAARLTKRRLEPPLLVEQLFQEAYQSLLRTPELLPVLKEAGVVDAGARGLVILAEGLVAGFRGEQMVDMLKPPAELLIPALQESSLTYAFCTEFILNGKGLSFKEIEQELESLGDSLMVAGSTQTLRVHIHTNQPETVLELAGQKGAVREIRINDMREQAKEQLKAVESSAEKTIGIVAVANGEGIKRILRSLGADVIVEGGQSMNPSTAEILQGVEGLPMAEVLIFPNNKNIVLTAQQALGLSKKKVAVVPTVSPVQAFSALLAFDESKNLRENADAMKNLAEQVRIGEVTRAVRDAPSAVGPIKEGNFLGLVDGEVRVVAASLEEASKEIIRSMGEGAQVITVLAGAEASPQEAQGLLAWIEENYPEAQSELHRGEQPLYYYIIGVE